MEPILITTPQAAEFLQLSQSVLKKMIALNEIPSLLIGGSRLFSVPALEAWVADQVARQCPTYRPHL